MLTREETFNVTAMVLTVLGLVVSMTSAVFALSGYKQSTVNTLGINAQVRAQRKLLYSALGTPAQHSGAGGGGGMASGATLTAVLEALRALQEYKLPEDEGT